MPEQRFPAGTEPRVRMARIEGDISIEVWDQDAILVDSDEPVRELYQAGEELVIDGCDDDLRMWLPARTLVRVEHCAGDLTVEGVRGIEIEHIDGDVTLEAIGGPVLAGSIHGDLSVEGAASLTVRATIDGDVNLENIARVEIDVVESDLHAEGVASLLVSSVGGDLSAEGLSEQLQAGSVGGDLRIESRGAPNLTAGAVGGDVHLEGDAGALRCGQVGSDCRLDDGRVDSAYLGNVGSDLRTGPVRELRASNVGGDAVIKSVTETLELGNVGGDCRIGNAEGNLDLGNVGGDLSLFAAMASGKVARARVGGSASIQVPANPSLTLQAVVGGEVRGVPSLSEGFRKRINLRYGEGAASLDLVIGCDLRISGGNPESRSASESFSPEFEREMGDFGREMGELGRELGRLGRELAAEISAAFANEGAGRSAAWAESVSRKVEEKARRLQEQVEEKTRRAEERAGRMHDRPRMRIRINEREWQLDPERLERIKEQARRAAAEGLSGALEAVERAIGRIRVPDAPGTGGSQPAPTPPTPPIPPTPPTPPRTGQTIKIEHEAEERKIVTPAPVANVEQERETILRMIAEGRISPEEGDLLLEALG